MLVLSVPSGQPRRQELPGALEVPCRARQFGFHCRQRQLPLRPRLATEMPARLPHLAGGDAKVAALQLGFRARKHQRRGEDPGCLRSRRRRRKGLLGPAQPSSQACRIYRHSKPGQPRSPCKLATPAHHERPTGASAIAFLC